MQPPNVRTLQVPRILNPVVSVLEELPKLYRDPNLGTYIDSTFGECQKEGRMDSALWRWLY